LRRDDEGQETGAELLQRILRERRARWEQKQLAKFAEQGKTPPNDWQDKYLEPVTPDLTNLPSLPEGWAWASVDQLAFVVRGASPRPAGDPRFFGGEIPWITVGSLTADGSMYLESVDQFVTNAGKNASRYVEPGTLLLTNSGATLGVPKITKIGGCINDGSVALLEVEGRIKIFLYWFLRTQTEKLRALNQGAAQPNLNTDIVRNITVPLTSMSEIEEINRRLDSFISSISFQEHSLDHALTQAAAQRKNILKAAFSGQLVPQDPNDEPASALLARIRAQREANAGTSARKRGRKARGAA
jgi:type I restriction enzyme S subunit